jgi:predicted small metal-binding protein
MKVLKCKDFGIDCPAEFRGASVEEVLAQAKRHGMEQHGQTEAQVNSSEVRKIAEEKAADEK